MAKPGFQLSDYIAGFAGAAVSAQTVLSQGKNPMAIQRFRFKFNVAADFESKGGPNGPVVCRVKPIKVNDQLMMDYAEHMGIEIECTLVPAFEEA